MEEMRIQLDYWLKQLGRWTEGKNVGRKAEGGIYVIKQGRFGSMPFLYSQYIAWSRHTAQKTTEDFIVYLLRSASSFP